MINGVSSVMFVMGILIGCVLVWLCVRELVCWYLKMNMVCKLLEENNSILEKSCRALEKNNGIKNEILDSKKE